MLVCRRSRRARLLGACARARLATFAFTFAFGSSRRPLSRFRAKTSLSFLLRVHDQELLAALTFPRLPRSSLDAHGRASSAHSLRAREFVSRFDESRLRSPSFRRSRLHLALGNRARPRLSTMAFACRTAPRLVPALRRSRSASPHVDPLRSCTSCDVHARNQPPLCLRSPVLRDRLPLAPKPCGSSAQIDLHLSTLTILRHFRAHVRARVRGPSRFLSKPRSTFTHMFSHIFRCRPLSIRAPSNAETCQPQHLEKFSTF